MANLQSTVTRSFVFTELSGAFYQTDIFKLLLENSCWTPLRRKRWPICKILSNALERSFTVSILLLIISATFWSSYCEIGAKRHCGQKYGQFLKHCHRPFIHRYPLLYLKYDVNNILESLLWNFYLTKLGLIRWQNWKILPQASESSFFATPIVLTIRTTLWSSYREIMS